MIKENLLGFK